VAFDAGSASKTKAAVIGFYNKTNNRDIIIKEIINEAVDTDGKDLTPLASNVKRFLEMFCTDKPIEVFGDPALAIYKDHEVIEAILERPVNLLNSFRPRKDYKLPTDLKGSYMNRMQTRIAVLTRELDRRRGDAKPAIIVLRGQLEKALQGFTLDFGAPFLYSGLFEGGFQWAVKNGIVKTPHELEQNHPVVDIVDAYSYYLMETRYSDGLPDKVAGEIKALGGVIQ
jgi:hypothetical protein